MLELYGMSDHKKVPFSTTERFLWLGLVAILLFTIAILSTNRVGLLSQPYQKLHNKSLYSQKVAQIYQIVLDNYVENIDPYQLYMATGQSIVTYAQDTTSILIDQASPQPNTQQDMYALMHLGLLVEKYTEVNNPNLDAIEYNLFVTKVFDNSAASLCGLKKGDYITHINDQPLENLTLNQIVDYLNNHRSSKFTLQLQRNAQHIETVLAQKKYASQVIHSELIGSVGYIKIYNFNHDLAKQLENILKDFLPRGIAGLVIDVRSSTGQSLEAAIQAASLFMQDQIVVQTQSYVNKEYNTTYKTTNNSSPIYQLPLSILVDTHTSPSGEIFTGALQSNLLVDVIGSQTTALARVQHDFALNSNKKNVVRLTVAYYIAPDNHNISKEGITPNIPINTYPLSSQQQKQLNLLQTQRVIFDFLQKYPQPTESQIKLFIRQQKMRYNLIPSQVLTSYIYPALYNYAIQPMAVWLEQDPAIQLAVAKLGEVSA
jgi:C-terminal peptidase prc